MPIDYSKYHPEWKTRIRPDILLRANNRCEFCNVPNHKWILRGVYCEKEVYQDDDGNIFDATNSISIGSDYLGEVDINGTNKFVKIVLTIAHLDHDINNNDYSNLKALCQRCHNRHDKPYRQNNVKAKKDTIQPKLF